jgi:hypothetical protein
MLRIYSSLPGPKHLHLLLLIHIILLELSQLVTAWPEPELRAPASIQSMVLLSYKPL